MKKAIYRGPKNIEVTEDNIPQISTTEALLKVKYCTVCGTDIRIYNFGHFKIPPGSGRVLGHEIVGEILEVGSEVRNLRPGMRVAVAPNVGCGTCDLCVQGWNQLCPDYDAFGITLDGGFEEYMKITSAAIRQGNILEIPDHVSYQDAVLVEPFSCVYNCYESLDLKAGDTVVVFGAGPIGLLHIQLARLGGAQKIILSEPVPERLQEGTSYGADILVNPQEEDVGEIIRRETRGKGADVVITACSVAAVQQQALAIAGVFGRINFFGGLPKGKEMVSLNTNLIHYKQLRVTGTTGSNHHQFRRALELISARKVETGSLISKVLPLEEIEDALAVGSTGKKVAIGFED